MRNQDGITDGPGAPIEPQTRTIEERTDRSRIPAVARVGRTIMFKGDMIGDEDLLIDGRVEGSVDVRSHSVTVGPKGNAEADIMGRIVRVEGQVQGNLTAGEQIVLLSSASVEGDLVAPRVSLEDGAYFRGRVVAGHASVAAESGGLGKQPEQRATKTRPREAEARSDQSRLTVS